MSVFHYHRIMESQNNLGLKGPLKVNWFQTTCNEQGHLALDQVAQSPIQPDLECFQGWGIYHLSGKPVPEFQHPHCKKFLPCIQCKSTLFEFKTITPCPISTGLAKMFILIFLTSPL